MTKEKNFSKEHFHYIKKQNKENAFIFVMRFAILFLVLIIWKLFALTGIIDAFITSSPSRIIKTIVSLVSDNNLFYHMAITLYETLLGFLIAVILGYTIALSLWWSEKLRRILKIALIYLIHF